MTTFLTEFEVYEKVMRENLLIRPDITTVISKIQKTRKALRIERENAKKPDFFAPYVSYSSPAYGIDAEIQAMIDYCRLKKIIDRSTLFYGFIDKSISCPLRRQCKNEEEEFLKKLLSKESNE